MIRESPLIFYKASNKPRPQRKASTSHTLSTTTTTSNNKNHQMMHRPGITIQIPAFAHLHDIYIAWHRAKTIGINPSACSPPPIGPQTPTPKRPSSAPIVANLFLHISTVRY
jgi:hypothetical protein